MASGRSYNCIARVERLFSYPLLVFALNKSGLTAELRDAFAALLKALYLDRHPHTPLPVPRRVFFDDKKPRPEGAPYGRFRDAPAFELELAASESAPRALAGSLGSAVASAGVGSARVRLAAYAGITLQLGK
jgi:hypothetical protein